MPAVQVAIAFGGVVAVLGLVAHGHDAGQLVEDGLSTHILVETGLMTAAMMLPVAAVSVPLVMRRSLPDRRLRAAYEHAIGFGLVWFTFGVVAAALIAPVGQRFGTKAAFVVVALLAATWQMSERRSIIVRRCGRLRSSPPRGLRADIGVAVAGADQARWCLRTCSVAMAAMILAPHPAIMLGMWLANLSEWAPGPNLLGRDRSVRPAIVFAVAAVVGTAMAAF